jgi:Xaa-Pro aminopeptidase
VALDEPVTETAVKLARLRAWMAERGVGSLHLRRSANVAWLSGGARSWIDTATDGGVASLLVTRDRQLLRTNDIERPRLRDEEPLGEFEVVSGPWYDDPRPIDGPVVDDRDLDASAWWTPLVPEEVARYRRLGADVGAALLPVAESVRPGHTEHAVAGEIARAMWAIGAVPIVIQVAADARAERYRHALPTDTRIERTVLFGLCARRDGLIVSASRMVAFGPVAPTLQPKVDAVAAIEAAAVAATRPGVTLGAVFEAIQRAYAEVGYTDAWRDHHQGGPCSYAPRDTVARPGHPERIVAPRAFAWNPTVPGAKSEDTVLCLETGCEVISRTPGWPRTAVGNDVLRR